MGSHLPIVLFHTGTGPDLSANLLLKLPEETEKRSLISRSIIHDCKGIGSSEELHWWSASLDKFRCTFINADEQTLVFHSADAVLRRPLLSMKKTFVFSSIKSAITGRVKGKRPCYGLLSVQHLPALLMPI